MLGSYALCRFYSWLHAYVHQDRIDCLWYFGYDVYVVDGLDAWLVAHWGESPQTPRIPSYLRTIALGHLCPIDVGLAAPRLSPRRSRVKFTASP